MQPFPGPYPMSNYAANPVVIQGPRTASSHPKRTLFTREYSENGFSRRESVFILALVVLALLLVAMIVVAVVFYLRKDDGGVCTSLQCAIAAATIHKKLDMVVKPCQDFFQFACGNWMKNTVIRGSSVSTSSEIGDEIRMVLKRILEANASSTDDDYLKKAKTLYASCYNTDYDRDIGTLKRFIVDQYGGWPLTTTSWNHSTFTLPQILTMLTLNGVYPLFKLDVSPNWNVGKSGNLLEINKPSDKDPYKKYRTKFKHQRNLASEEDILDIGVRFGIVDHDTAKEEVKQIVWFLNAIKKIKEPGSEIPPYIDTEKPTPQNINNYYSPIKDMKSLAKTIMAHPSIGIHKINDEEIHIYNSTFGYFERLNKVIEKTPKRTVMNSLMWSQIYKITKTLGGSFSSAQLRIRKRPGYTTSSSRYSVCTETVTKLMALAIAPAFLKKRFDDQTKKEATKMVKNLYAAFNELVYETDWLDEETIRVVKRKNDKMKRKVGFESELVNKTFLSKHYTKLTLQKKNFMENAIGLLKLRASTTLRSLRKPTVFYTYNVAAVNAFYDQLTNKYVMQAGQLQPPDFHKNNPKFINYGAAGSVVGHELSHGFDNDGRYYDENGDWKTHWTQDSWDKYDARAKCFVDQYNSYSFPSINKTAYRNWVDSEGKEEKRLPGLDFSPDQLFFVSFAQSWCDMRIDEALLNQIETDVHAPERSRVIGTLSNSKVFNRVFKCKESDTMNPKKKCSLW